MHPAANQNVIDLDAARAERVAHQIAGYGSLSNAIQAAHNDEAFELCADLLRYERDQQEAADPSLKIARLNREADNLDATAERVFTEEAEFAGKAEFRCQRGERENNAQELELATSFKRRAEACQRYATSLQNTAFGLRLEAASIEATNHCRATFGEIVGIVQGVR